MCDVYKCSLGMGWVCSHDSSHCCKLENGGLESVMLGKVVVVLVIKRGDNYIQE